MLALRGLNGPALTIRRRDVGARLTPASAARGGPRAAVLRRSSRCGTLSVSGAWGVQQQAPHDLSRALRRSRTHARLHAHKHAPTLAACVCAPGRTHSHCPPTPLRHPARRLRVQAFKEQPAPPPEDKQQKVRAWVGLLLHLGLCMQCCLACALPTSRPCS